MAQRGMVGAGVNWTLGQWRGSENLVVAAGCHGPRDALLGRS